MTVEIRGEFHLSDFAAGDVPGLPRVLPDKFATRFAQVALGQIRCVVIGQRLSSSSRRAESTDNSGRRSNPRTSLRSENSTPAMSSAGTRRAAGRPRSRTSRPRFPRAAARTHCPVFMCNSRIVMVVICAHCVTLCLVSTLSFGRGNAVLLHASHPAIGSMTCSRRNARAKEGFFFVLPDARE